MTQIITNGGDGTIAANNTSYGEVFNGGTLAPLAVESGVQQIVSAPGVIKSAYGGLSATLGSNLSGCLMLNGAQSTLSWIIAAGATVGSNIGSEVSVVPGDLISLQYIHSNPGAVVRGRHSFIFSGTSPNDTLLGGNTRTSGLSTTVNNYLALCNFTPAPFAAESGTQQIITTPGTLKNLYVKCDTAPGGTGSRIFTVRVNGAATPVTAAIIGANTVGSDYIHTGSVNPGDLVDLECAPFNTPALSSTRFGLTFTSTNPNESLLLGTRAAALGAGIVNVLHPNQGNSAGISTPAARRQQQAQAGVLKNFYVMISDPVEIGGSSVFSLDNNFKVTIYGGSTLGSEYSMTKTLTDGMLFGGMSINSQFNGSQWNTMSWGMTIDSTPNTGHPQLIWYTIP